MTDRLRTDNTIICKNRLHLMLHLFHLMQPTNETHNILGIHLLK